MSGVPVIAVSGGVGSSVGRGSDEVIAIEDVGDGDKKEEFKKEE